MKISPTQQEVLDKLRESGKPLVRWRGGFWTYQGCEVKSTTPTVQGYIADVPAWYVDIRTIRAMEKKELLRRRNVHPEEWRDDRELVTP